MQNYMTKLNNIKKYILPFLFLVMTFVMIPKEAYYKKGTIDIVATTTEGSWKGYLYMVYPLGYRMEDSLRSVSGEKIVQKKIKNTILNVYILDIDSPVGEVSELKFISGKKIVTIPTELRQKYFKILKEDIRFLYTFNIFNIFLYLMVVLLLFYNYFKNGVNIDFKNIGIFSLALVLLSLSLNMKWLSKANGIFLSLTILSIYLDRKKIRFGYLEIIGLVLLVLSLVSEYFNFFNYEKTYIYFQNGILMIIAIKIWSFNYVDKELLKDYFKIPLILVSLINLNSPLVFGGIYTFTFGVLMAILLVSSTNRLLFYRENKAKIITNIFSLLLGLQGLIASSRRTMLVALLIYFIYLFIKLLKNNKKKTTILVFLGIIFSSIIVGTTFFNERTKIKKLITSIVNVKTDQGNIQRLLMWRRDYFF